MKTPLFLLWTHFPENARDSYQKGLLPGILCITHGQSGLDFGYLSVCSDRYGSMYLVVLLIGKTFRVIDNTDVSWRAAVSADICSFLSVSGRLRPWEEGVWTLANQRLKLITCAETHQKSSDTAALLDWSLTPLQLLMQYHFLFACLIWGVLN